ncbi:MAG: heme biosynthesis HemY N-terminal domain-containing protein [Pseudomonadota bacterium]
MIRVLIFILSVVFVAGAVTYFAGMNEWIEAEAFGLKYSIHAGLAIGFVIFAFLFTIFFTSWFKDLAAIPGKLRARDREAKRARGVAALTRGLEAVFVGDASDAQHHARVAQRNLEDLALTRLLTARAAQLAGDEKTAGESFSAMLEAPETEFLGLHGLYLKAVREGDQAAARGFAERAFRLRPNAGWAFQSVFDLGLERGAWGETRDALALGVRNKVIDAVKAKRAEAALLTADAYAAEAADDRPLALKDAEAALKIAPAFAPAAIIAARLHQEGGKKQRAARILETAFAAAPHAALIDGYAALYADESAEKRASNLNKIAERNPTSREGKIARARAAVLTGDFAGAIATVEPLLMEKATAREYALMAEAVRGEHGDAAATVWLEKAAAAPRDYGPGEDGAFHFTREGWARLVREYRDHERLAPPPLEDAPRGLSLDELKLLAPPPKPEPTPDPETPEAETAETDVVETTPAQAVPDATDDASVNDALIDDDAPTDAPEADPGEAETSETIADAASTPHPEDGADAKDASTHDVGAGEAAEDRPRDQAAAASEKAGRS